MSDWREQYGRILRLRHQLDWVTLWSDEGVFDSFYSFAQTCYHFVDWLENDPLQLIRRLKADQHVASSPELAFRRDICHGSKHGVLEAKNVQTEVRTKLIGMYLEQMHGSEQWKEKIVHKSYVLVRFEGDLYPRVHVRRSAVHPGVGPTTRG